MQQGVDGTVTTFAWDWATGVPELLTDGNKRYLVGHDTLGWEDTAGWTYAVPDALGSMRQAVDGAGELIESREWTPYGAEIGDPQAGLGYTGEWWDAVVGLQYLRARWYDVQSGRFTSEDSAPGYVSVPRSLHIYAYAWADPVNLIDPSGLQVPPPQDCGPGEICYTGTYGPYTPQTPGIVPAGGVSADRGPFAYERGVAVEYAKKNNCDWEVANIREDAWDYLRGRTPYNPFLSSNCTHFVSQALATGGMPMTTEWHWDFGNWRWPVTTGCGKDPWNSPCTPAWGAAKNLREYLIDTLGFPHDFLDPIERDEIPDMSEIVQRLNIESGDVVFHGSGDDPAGHTAMVVGWGPPTQYQLNDPQARNPQPCFNWPPDTVEEGTKQLPWIIDRDGPGYPRAFNDVGTDHRYRVEFVHIPDWIVLPMHVILWDTPPYP